MVAIAGLSVELLFADGNVIHKATNGVGHAFVEGIPRGQCNIRVPDLDGGAWQPAAGAISARVDKRTTRHHVVRAGECLSRIAQLYGLNGWRGIWEAPENKALHDKRKNPNVLYPGDQLVIPGIAVHELVRPTDQTHRIIVTANLVEFRAILQDHNQHPHKEEPYELHFSTDANEAPRTGTTTAEGKVLQALPISVQRIRVYLPGPALRFEFAMQRLLPVPDHACLDDDDDPATHTLAVKALQMRLNALGFACGPVDGILGPLTRHAVALLDEQNAIQDPVHDPDDPPETPAAAQPELDDVMLAQIDTMFEAVS